MPPNSSHGRVDHPGAPPGGRRAAALYYDRKVSSPQGVRVCLIAARCAFVLMFQYYMCMHTHTVSKTQVCQCMRNMSPSLLSGFNPSERHDGTQRLWPSEDPALIHSLHHLSVLMFFLPPSCYISVPHFSFPTISSPPFPPISRFLPLSSMKSFLNLNFFFFKASHEHRVTALMIYASSCNGEMSCILG